jgi:Uma2 family endonuclease
MIKVITARATIADLSQVDEKAELIGGRIVRFMPTGDLPSDVANEIFVSLRAYAKATGCGVAKADGVGYVVPELPSGRESFSPDASYFVGPRPANRMRFLAGAPQFAVEVRSENDYGASAEIELSAKRNDYFAAGTSVVWDVDPLAQTVAVYRASAPTQPTIHRAGEIADAEPAVPGWRMAIDEIFAS